MKVDVIKRKDESVRYVLIEIDGQEFKIEEETARKLLVVSTNGFASLRIFPAYVNQVLLAAVEK